MIGFFSFILGLVVGSFLNSVIYGLEREKSISRIHSQCPECGHGLSVFDLVPVLSFILLRGKCRYCGGEISWQYPLVELGTGGLFVLSQHRAQKSPAILFYWVVVSLLILIFVYDLKHFVIPDRVVYPAMGLAVGYRLLQTIQGWLRATHGPPLPGLAAGLGAGVFFGLIYLISKGEWMGFGDVKTALFMGLFLGFPLVLVGLFSAVLSGALVGTVLILLGRKNLKSKVPFGPFLVGGTLFALFWGKAVLSSYFSLLVLIWANAARAPLA